MTTNQKPQIAFCYFVKMSTGKNAVLTTLDEKPYAYLNNLEIAEGEYALVHVGGRSDPFALVQVARNVPVETRKAAEKISQPLIAKVNIDMARVRSDFTAIKDAKSMIQDSLRQSRIDDILGIDRTAVPAGTPALMDQSKSG